MILREYVRRVVCEALTYKKISNVVDELNSVVSEYYREERSYSLASELEKTVKALGMEKLGAGQSRRAYVIKGEDWVLKLAYGSSISDEYLMNSMSNKEEVDISTGKHGLGARDLFIEVYDWDKISDNPSWVICEKVITFKELGKSSIISMEDIQKIFPTFFSAIKPDAISKSNVQFFLSFVYYTIDDLDKFAKRNTGLRRIDFYNAMKSAAEWANFSNEDIVDFDNVVFSEDFRRIAQACAYSLPSDVHSSNIGLRLSDNLSANDIVILDYDLSSYY